MKMKTFLVASFVFIGVSSMAQGIVSLTEIVAEFQANMLAADSRYLDKILTFNVKVSGVEKDADGKYYLVPMAAKRVRCYFTRDQNADLATLKKGDEITFHGVCRGFDRDRGGNHLVFTECGFGLAGATLNPAMEEELSEVKKSLFILKGTQGTGSGFVASIDGTKYVISNFHVFDGNDNLKLIDCDNREIEAKSIKFAHDRDIALFEMDPQSPYEPLTIQPDISSVSIGTPVRNYGNSAGGGVFTELAGKVLGVGPSVIEVDALFVGGNSGSPVLSFPSMKVLGVATYATFEHGGSWVTAGTRFDGAIRRYATRIDNIDTAKLEVYDKAKFDAETKSLHTLEDLLMLKAAALSNLKGVGHGRVSWADFQLYAGKIPEASRKFKLSQLIQQWNRELAKVSIESPDQDLNSRRNSSKTVMEQAGGTPSGKLGGIIEDAGVSIQKIPYADLERLLFFSDPKLKFTYKRLQVRADMIAEASSDLRKNFKTSYENIRALIRK